MKKYIVLLLLILIGWLVLTYHAHVMQERGANLVMHAYYGDLIDVKNAVEQGAPLQYQFTFEDPSRQYTFQTFNALQAAASSGNEDVILFLLEQGMDIDGPTPDGWTPLFIAARDGQAEAAKLLVFQGANLNAQTNLGSTALTMVVTQDYPTEKARLDLLTYMLKRGADPTIKDVYNHTPLYYAEAQQKQDVAKLLREYKPQS